MPYLDRVRSHHKDPVTEMAAFKAGEVDFIASFSPEHVDTLKAQVPNARIMTGKETTPMMATMKVTISKDGKPMSKERVPHPLFGDVRVRKAARLLRHRPQGDREDRVQGAGDPLGRHDPAGHHGLRGSQRHVPLRPGQGEGALGRGRYGPQKPLTFELMTNTEKSVFNVIATVIKEQMARIGVTANIRLVDNVTSMTSPEDAPWDMYVEDLLSLITLDSNAYLTTTPSTWNTSRHTDPKVDEYYARYAKELDGAKRKAIAKELASTWRTRCTGTSSRARPSTWSPNRG